MSSEDILRALILVQAVDLDPVDNACTSCKNVRPGVNDESHVQCNKPMEAMTCTSKALDEGKFNYPVDFDPSAMTSFCLNFESAQS